MKILHITPFYFHPESVIGGGERYAHELASAMAEENDTVLLTFSKQPRSEMRGKLRIEFVRSVWTSGFFHWLKWADVIHCHQVCFTFTKLALIAGAVTPRKVFLTDLGGGQLKNLFDLMPVQGFADGFLLLSGYSKKIWLEQYPEYAGKIHVIGGGVNPSKFYPGKGPKSRNILFVGRILPHKGIDVLIDALNKDMTLEIIGKPYSPVYLDYLKVRAHGKKVSFLNSLGDGELTEKYQNAAVAVQPSVYKDYRGVETRIPELFGLAAVEAMACGTPVIVSDAASLPELVREGETGFIVPVSDARALNEKLSLILNDPEKAAAMGKKAAEDARSRFSWKTAADRCLALYSARPL